MKNKIPAAPPGTHGVIFYKFCRLLTAAVPVLARPAWSARQQLSFVSPLSSLLSLPCQDSRLMKPPGEVRHCNTFPVITSQSLHSPGQASSYLTPPWSASRGQVVLLPNTTAVGSCEAQKLQYMHAWSLAWGSAVLYYWDNLRRGAHSLRHFDRYIILLTDLLHRTPTQNTRLTNTGLNRNIIIKYL